MNSVGQAFLPVRIGERGHSCHPSRFESAGRRRVRPRTRRLDTDRNVGTTNDSYDSTLRDICLTMNAK
jgi:hypothetical protein